MKLNVLFYIPYYIYSLGLKVRDTMVLTVINMRQDNLEYITPATIARSLMISIDSVKKSIKVLLKDGLISSKYEINITRYLPQKGTGFVLHLFKEVQVLPGLNIKEKLFLSLLLEDWKSGYFCMMNETIMERINISRETIRRYLKKFEDLGWIDIFVEVHINNNTFNNDSYSRSRKIKVHKDVILELSKTEQRKIDQQSKVTKGLLHSVSESILIENKMQLNYWVHAKGQKKFDQLMRYHTGSAISMFKYLTMVFDITPLDLVSFQDLNRMNKLVYNFRDNINHIQLLIIFWFSIELDLPNSLFQEIRHQYYSECRSIQLFLKPILLDYIIKEFKKYIVKNENKLVLLLDEKMRELPIKDYVFKLKNKE